MEKPFYLASRDRWCVVVQVNGKRRRKTLGKTKVEAFNAWEQMRKPTQATSTSSYFFLASKFLDWSQRRVDRDETSKATHGDYRRYIMRFAAHIGDVDAKLIKQHHVNEWVASNTGWGPAAERHAITAVKRSLNWAVQQGYIDKNPVGEMSRPATRRRYCVVTPDEHAAIIKRIDASNQPKRRGFRWVVLALKLTGCRPGEVVSASIETSDQETWTLVDHKKKLSQRKPRVVYLSPCMQTLQRLVANGRNTGPMFRTARSEPLTYNAIRNRFAGLSDQLGKDDLIAYAYRHAWITDALLSGVDIAVVAELAGTSVAMIERHYSEFTKHRSRMVDAAKQAMGYVPPAIG